MNHYYKAIIFIFASCFFSNLSLGQAIYSPISGRLLYLTQKAGFNNISIDDLKNNALKKFPELTDNELKDFVISDGKYGPFTTGFLTVDPSVVSESELNRLGIFINSKADELWTATIPLISLEKLGDISGIIKINVDNRNVVLLDLGIKDTKVDQVHAGTGIKSPLKGDGVIVGIIDGGFDFTHPIFRKKDSKEIRVTRFWNHSSKGNVPPGFSYGEETVGADLILEKKNDGTEESHATHVTGIAAGAGAPGLDQYVGVAPNAEIIAVKTNFGQSSISDGIRYIFRQADFAKKPVSINISIGGRIGPHDGTSDFDRFVDRSTKPGKIIVSAAGNWGDYKHHIYKNLKEITDTINTFVRTANDNNKFGYAYVDIWSGKNQVFGTTITVYDSSGNKIKDVAFSKNDVNTKYYQDSLALPEGKVFFGYQSINYYSSTSNQKSNTLWYLGSSNAPLYRFGLKVHPIDKQGSEIHMWNAVVDFQDTLAALKPIPGFIHGDTMTSVSEVGGTGKSILTTGAHTIRNKYTNLEGKEENIFRMAAVGALAPFSGTGPTVDLRTKPDITAPGNTVISGISSKDKNWMKSTIVKEYQEGDQKWQFAVSHGTSMATPFAAGVVALMLQVHPTLTFQQARDFLRNSARKDEFTGVIPPTGVNNWGWGKLDAIQALKDLWSSPIVSNEILDKITPSFEAYPNPTSEYINLEMMAFSHGKVKIQIINALGSVLIEKEIICEGYICETKFNLSNISTGIYHIKISQGNKFAFKKISVL